MDNLESGTVNTVFFLTLLSFHEIHNVYVKRSMIFFFLHRTFKICIFFSNSELKSTVQETEKQQIEDTQQVQVRF